MIVRADSVPTSWATPFSSVSTRNGSADMPLPVGPIAVTLIDDCDPPSWLMLSGFAVTSSDNASPDGPPSGGASLVCTVHPTSASFAGAEHGDKKRLMGTPQQ